MPRVAAWSVLRSGSSTPLREVDRAARERGLNESDRALLRRLVGMEVRHRGTLRAMVRAFSWAKLKPDMIAHLHVGLVQLLYFDRIPDYAATSSTAAAVGETLGQSKVRVAQEFLGRVVRARREGESGDPRRDIPGRGITFPEPLFRDPAEHPLLWIEDALSLPATIGKRWVKRYGRERTEALAHFFLEEPPLAFRAIGCERDELAAELADLGAHPRHGSHPRTLVCEAEETGIVLGSAAFRYGRLAVQGEGALAAAELMEAAPGERLLDLCAAPGGKSAVMAEAGASVLAADIDPRRLRRVLETRARLHLGGLSVIASDGANALRSEARFDGVLVDAPCTNTGVLGARPGARWRFGPKGLAELVETQATLLAAGARHVRPGGRLVWSTCSLEPEENERQVAGFLEGHEGWALEAERVTMPGVAPDGLPADGGYAARLRRA